MLFKFYEQFERLSLLIFVLPQKETKQAQKLLNKMPKLQNKTIEQVVAYNA